MAVNDQIKIDVLVDDTAADAALKRFKDKVITQDKELANRPPIQLGGITNASTNIRGVSSRDFDLKPTIRDARAAADALKLTNFQMANLTYQINDIATMTMMGASPFQIIASQGGQIYQIFGSVNGMTAAVGAGVAKVNAGLIAWGTSLAAVGTLAAAGAVAIYGAYRVTTDIRVEAERRLKLEERIAKVYGEQNKALFDQKKAHAEAAQQQQYDFDRTKQRSAMEAWSNDQLTRRKALLEQMIQLGGTGESMKAWSNEVLDINAQVNKNANAPAGSSVFNQGWELAKKQQEARIAQMKAWAENVEKAKIRVNELTVAHKALFEGLTVQAYSDNPFVKIAVEGDRAFRELKENIRGLPEEMQNAAMASQRAFNAKQLFGAMVDNAMGVFDLREMARTLGDDSASRKAMANSAYSSDWQEYQRRLSLGTVMNEEANREYFERRRQFIDGNFNGESASDRLERQIDALKRLSPSNADEQAIIDQRIIGLVRSIDPSQLSANQRSEGINAALREAERQERYRQQSLEVARQTLETNRSIDENQKRLLAVAEKGGVAGIDNALKIQIQDDTGRASVEARGNSNDVSARYGSYSGGGGLTSY